MLIWEWKYTHCWLREGVRKEFIISEGLKFRVLHWQISKTALTFLLCKGEKWNGYFAHCLMKGSGQI